MKVDVEVNAHLGGWSVKPRRRANKVEKAQRTSPSNTIVNTLPKYNSSQTERIHLSISIHILLSHRRVIWEHNVGAQFRSFQSPASPRNCVRQENHFTRREHAYSRTRLLRLLPPTHPAIYPRRCIPRSSPAITHTITIRYQHCSCSNKHIQYVIHKTKEGGLHHRDALFS